MVVPAFSLKPPPQACRVKAGAMSASTNRLHGVMPNRRFEDVSRAAQPISGVLHVTMPVPAIQAQTNHYHYPNLPRLREQVRERHHHADMVPEQLFPHAPNRGQIGSLPRLGVQQFASLENENIKGTLAQAVVGRRLEGSSTDCGNNAVKLPSKSLLFVLRSHLEIMIIGCFLPITMYSTVLTSQGSQVQSLPRPPLKTPPPNRVGGVFAFRPSLGHPARQIAA